jgi:hypothetical protein
MLVGRGLRQPEGGWMRKCVVLIAAIAASVGAVEAATANGPTPDQLTAAGWTCFRDPGAPRIICSDPGHGRPVPGDPNAPPSYNFKVFDLDGTFIGTIHLIRSDLYEDQPCPQTGGLYFPITVIGYHRCEHF